MVKSEDAVSPGASIGPATDKRNDPVIDPTANVIALVDADARRQDDLRKAEEKLRDRERKHIEKLSSLRERHARELRAAESARIDANRAADLAALREYATSAAARAEVLAKQVETTAIEARGSLVAALDPIRVAVTELTQRMYEQQGQKQQQVETRQGITFGQGLVASGLALILAVFAIYAATRHSASSGTGTGGGTAVVCTATYHPSPCPQP